MFKKWIFLIIALIPFLSIPTSQAGLTAHCFIKAGTDSGINVKDYGAVKKYSGLNCQGSANVTDCSNRATSLAASINLQTMANWSCAANVPNQTPIYMYSKVGTHSWRKAHYFGTLTNTPASSVTTYTCPSNAINLSLSLTQGTFVYGGVAPEGKCMEDLVSGIIWEAPFPENGTPISTWGYTWLGELHRRVEPIANVTQTPAQCHF